MDKSPEAFRTISEVAEALETPAHVLRFWESRFPQIRPVKRAGGRRYYRPADVALLTGIKHLLHEEGLTIRGVQKILREQGVRHVAAVSGQTDLGLTDLGQTDLGLTDFGNDDDVDAQLIAAMSRHPDDSDDDAEDQFPGLQAVESAQVVALESALARRDAMAPADAPAMPPATFGAEEVPEVADSTPTASAPVALTLETLAAALRTLPRPLPEALRQRLRQQGQRLDLLRDQMDMRLVASVR